MANIVYNKFLDVIGKKQYAWDSGTTVRAMLERNTSTYVANKDHATVQEIISNGFVEITANGYSRQTLANKAVTINTSTDEVYYDCDDLNFGNIEVGQTVKGILFFIRTGASDSPASDIPVAYIDTATGLPMSTGGGAFNVIIPSNGLFTTKQGT